MNCIKPAQLSILSMKIMKIYWSYAQIREIHIPEISLQKSTNIISRLRPNVADFNSLTPQHFINARPEGLLHFNAILNAIITDVNHSTSSAFNAAHGLLLYKGHNKDKTSDRSYRTISTCPIIAKSLDLYL